MDDGEIIILSPEALDLLMDSRHDMSKSSLPQWLHNNAKIVLLHKNNFHKGWLYYDDKTGWEFQMRKRNGDVRVSIKLPNLLSHHSKMIDSKAFLPGWSNSVRQIVATTRHVSAKNLANPIAPGTLRIGLATDNPDRHIWLASYIEEIQGLLRMETFDVITSAQYRELIKKYGVKAIPSMCVLTVKVDDLGNPVRAKSRIVGIGNFEKEVYSKGDCFAPVASHYGVRLIVCLALSRNRLLKQGDCKNAFVQSELNEVVVVKPPPYCPYSNPSSYWLLKKSLYGLRRAPRYWVDRISSVLRRLKLVECPNEACYFVGCPVDGLPELHLVIYVDDFVYFSTSDDVENYFEKALKEHIIVDLWAQSITSWELGLIGTPKIKKNSPVKLYKKVTSKP